MKKVNKKLLISSIVYAVFLIAFWGVLFGAFPLLGEEGSYLTWIFSEYFVPYLAAGLSASFSWFPLMALIFAICSTVSCVFGILKAVGVLQNKLGAKLLQKLGKIFGALASITAVWFAFSIFMAFAPSDAPDPEDIVNMVSGLVPLIHIIIVSICGSIVHKNVKKAVVADEAAAKESPAVEPAEEVAETEIAE